MSALILLTMMNRTHPHRSSLHFPSDPAPDDPAPAAKEPEPSKYDLALNSIELKEKEKKALRLEPVKRAREFRTKLNELASSDEVRFLRRALELEGRDYQPIHRAVYFEEKTFFGDEEELGVQLALSPSGFRILEDTPEKMADPEKNEVCLRWKWTSRLMELCKDGMNIEKVESWVKEEVKRRLEENSPAKKEAKEEIVP